MNFKNVISRWSSLAVIGSMMCLSPLAVAAGKSDGQIQDSVAKYLQSKSQYQGVRASAEDSIVTLDGKVNLYIDSVDLEKKVKRIKSVDGVRNHVTVQSNVPDDELQETLSDKLRYDRVGQGIAFNAITLGVKDGVATLGGKVRDYPSRDSAVAIASTTPGVKDVVDNIEVAPTSMFDDDLRLKLFGVIYKDPVLSKYAMDPQKPIRIVVDGGHVTLAGIVDSPMDRNVAGLRASGVSGVFSVNNQLMVLNK
jgi:hyperosmotically inducible protein